MNNPACGTSRIVGCRFSVFPMTDRFVQVITEALASVNTDKVWMYTDDLCTCIRGRAEHVFDVTRAIFAHSAATGVHTVFNGTFSIGCPGDSKGDVYMSEDDTRMNESLAGSANIETACHFSLYPLGTENYMDIIYQEVERAKSKGTLTQGIHYASRLDGTLSRVFDTLEDAFMHAIQTDRSHLVMTVVVSANSPSPKEI
ncbi:Ykof family thiamine-binding protein [Paenibacillus sp. N3/727]|uniref:Ykof family thiamine-binding protein n=1 Tax=Paenibacillus sp. N3/727 TaxID=2925845 RepID=UPI001F5378E3|nr:Ykof family thiamine-binding protein [Paenibacillus sp. N3/727]UNK16807.1 Ykof family thiamine-binding protein [Paenibacillus sp. N3/727]